METRLLTKRGRPVDLWAAVLAAFGSLLALVCAVMFFLGFAENDTRWEHLLSALLLTLGLFGLAIVPFAITARLAWQAHNRGGRMRDYLWTLFLMGPWVILGVLAARMTPLSLAFSLSVTGLAAGLCLWAGVSLALDLRRGNSGPTPHVDTIDQA